jgi:hypothetical protein
VEFPGPSLAQSFICYGLKQKSCRDEFVSPKSVTASASYCAQKPKKDEKRKNKSLNRTTNIT